MTCTRFDEEAVLKLQSDEPLDAHFAECPDCRRARSEYDALLESLLLKDLDDLPGQEWEQEFWANIRSTGSGDELNVTHEGLGATSRPGAAPTTSVISLEGRQFLQLCEQGDHEGAREFCRRYTPSLRRYLASKVENEADVEKLVELTLRECMNIRADSLGRSSFRGWILGVGNELLRQYYRNQLNRPGPLTFSEVSVRELCDGLPNFRSPEEQRRALTIALRSLSSQSQVLLALHYWEQMTDAELGEYFDLSESEARAGLESAKAQLRVILREHSAPKGYEGLGTDLDEWSVEVRVTESRTAGK